MILIPLTNLIHDEILEHNVYLQVLLYTNKINLLQLNNGEKLQEKR